MEGTPFVVESNNEDDQEKRRKEERASKAKKPEVFGMLAVESPDEETEPTALEKAWESTRKPDAETEEPPAETEVAVERVPEERARAIVQEMVASKPEPEEEPEPATEIEPKLEIEAEPEPEAETETNVEAEEEPIEIPDASKVEAPEPVVMAEAAPAEKPEPKVEAEPEPEIEAKPEAEKPEPKVEAPEPVVMEEVKSESAEKPETPPDEDDKKPGFIRSLFRRGDRNKSEEEPKPDDAEKEVPEPEPVVEDEPKPEAESKEPKFEFKEKTEEEITEKPKAEEAPEEIPEEPKTERKPEAKAERIGKMLLTTEAEPVEHSSEPVNEASVSSQEAEKKLHVEASPIEPASGKRVDTLNRAELMQLSEKIEINGNNLRHIYETHLIGERGLRRLVAEHIRGGDLPKALRREVMEHEMDFERDPVMRNMIPTSADPIDSNSNVLEKLLEKADVSLADADNPTVSFKASKQPKASRQWQSHRYRSLDIALVATISTLSLLIILVFLIKG